jgi:hypothetical protein
MDEEFLAKLSALYVSSLSKDSEDTSHELTSATTEERIAGDHIHFLRADAAWRVQRIRNSQMSHAFLVGMNIAKNASKTCSELLWSMSRCSLLAATDHGVRCLAPLLDIRPHKRTSTEKD